MSGRIPIGSAILMTLGITTLGYGIMAFTTPTEKEFYDALSPDLKKKVDEQRKLSQGARDQLVKESQQRLDQIKLQANNDSPVWADDFDPNKKK
ncbi:hypothetical protein JCM3766R1_006666 [Sporobolomyces carnicolor]